MGYLKRFEALAKDLEKNKLIEIVEFKAQPPIKSTELKSVEKKIGAELAAGIRSFYEEANGLKFHWQIRPDVSPQEAKDLRKKSTDYYVEIAEYIGNPFAIINLIPLDESIVTKKWKELTLGLTEKTVEFAGEEYDAADFAKTLKPFDIMNRELCMAFVIKKGEGNPPVILLSEGYTDWTNSRITDFPSYMEMLLATRGIVEAREKIFSKANGTSEKPLVGDAKFWSKYEPKLFRGK